MKFTKLFITLTFFTLGINLVQGQIRSNGRIDGVILNASTFLDASSNIFSNSINNGKGLAFPRTDLTTFTFATDGSFFSFPTYYDGMVVYNTASGTTPASGSGVGGEQVEPGFYYFSNPTAGSIMTTGSWIPFTHVAVDELNNLYTGDGEITENRVVSLSGTSTLSFVGTVSNTVIYNTHVELKRGLQDSSGSFGTEGQVLSSTGSDTTQWISAAQGLIRLETGNYTAQIEDGTILVQPTGSVVITIPTPTPAQNGTSLTVKRANEYTGSNTLSLASAASFDQSTNNLNLNLSYQGYTLKAYEGAWYITQRF